MCISSVPQWNELQILFSKLILKALVKYLSYECLYARFREDLNML